MREIRSRLCGCLWLIGGTLMLGSGAGAAVTSSVTLLSSRNPALSGEPVTLTAVINAGATGQVTFYDGVTVLGTSGVISSQAKFTTSLLTAGVHNLHARYSGDGIFQTSVSAPLLQVITALTANGFQQVISLPTGTSGLGPPAVADFNGDGKPDIAFVTPGTVSVYLGNGDGTFSATPPYSVGTTVSVTAGDFNRDGKTDLVVSGPNFIGMLSGNGDGTFNSVAFLPSNQGARSLATADFNNDGKPDLADSEGFIRLGNGDGTFQAPVPMATNISVGGAVIATADVNGDGNADVIMVTGANALSVLLGNGDGTFQAPVAILPAFQPNALPGAVAVGDLNGDGKIDIAALVTGSGGNLAVLLGNGDGTFKTPVKYTINGMDLAIGDFNGDGKQDVLVTGISGGNNGVEFHAGNGDGTLQAALFYGAFARPGPATVGDFNGDGRTDFVYASPGIATFESVALPDLTVSISHSGNFAPASPGNSYSITVTNLPFAMTTAPVTVTAMLPTGVSGVSISGVGWSCNLSALTCTRADTIGLNSSFSPITILVAVGNVSGAIVATATVSGGGDTNAANNKATDTIIIVQPSNIGLTAAPNPATLSQPVTLSAVVTPLSAAGQVTFYDGATVLGIATIANGQAAFTTRALGAGVHFLHARYDPGASAFFAPSVSATVAETVNSVPDAGFQFPLLLPGAGMTFVSIGDFNGDNKPDLAVGGLNQVTVFLSNGDGTFRAAQTTPVTQFTFLQSPVTVADITGDGKADLIGIATAGAVNQIVVMAGNGDGTFQPPKTFGIGSSVAVADFTGDGKPDLGFASASPANNFTILPGNGDGTFGAPISFALSDAALNVVAADFNGDGKADLAIVSASIPISVLLGNGDGTFQPPLSTSLVGNGPLVVADFTGDGKPDLAAGSISSGANHILFTSTLAGKGDGTFQPLTTYPANFVPVAAADINGDGKLDLVAGASGVMGVFLGNGDGTLQNPTVLGTGSPLLAVGDFNGDGRTDIASAGATGSFNVLFGSSFATPNRINLTVWRPTDGTWYVYPATQPAYSQQWGLQGDIPVAADFDHDGQLDFAIWRPLNGLWYVVPSSNPKSPIVQQWGLPGDIPVPGDFDGDGKTDFAIWRPVNGSWYIMPSSNPSNQIVKQFGLPGDFPVQGDFDGDGKADYAVWRPGTGTWYVNLSSTGQQVIKPWGLPGDLPVAADFDGDGKTDYAVWRPSEGNWYIIPSRTGVAYVQQWGLPGDFPVPRDYDLDGKADVAVWRPSSGYWFILPSANPNSPLSIQWGLPGDMPIFKPVGE